jgi:TPR repeat protein
MPSTHHDKSLTPEKLATLPLRAVRVSAVAGDVAAQTEIARRLSRRGKNTEALRWFRLAARSGDPERQLELGIVLYWDHAMHREGTKWIRRSAEQDHVGAQYFLGAELATGETIRKNVKEAGRWYGRAARKGHGESQYNLALMCWAGEGMPKNVAAAHKWLEKAARSSDLLALRLLADAFSSGLFGYRKDGVRANYWRNRYNRVSQEAIVGS